MGGKCKEAEMEEDDWVAGRGHFVGLWRSAREVIDEGEERSGRCVVL